MNGVRKEIRRGRWSIGEVVRLRELYGVRNEAAIARALGRPVSSIRKMAERVFKGPKKTGPWSAEEMQTLKHCLGISSPELIARVLRRSDSDVQSKISSLGKKTNSGPWTRTDILELKQLYGSRSDADLAIILGRPETAIRKQSVALNLSKDKGFLRNIAGKPTKMPRWDRKAESELRKLYPEHTNLEIARKLGRSVKAIISKAHNLKLQKTEERLAQMGRQNVSLRDDRQ